MATKKTSSKKKPNPLLQTDPPILVGGGGSSYLWVNVDQDQRQVSPTSNDPVTGINPGSPTPRTRASYTCSRVARTPPRIFFSDGVNPEVPLNVPVAGRKTWYIRFE
ncbi:MAG: hypothetical protein QOF72_2449 [Blastocatellia bacterium]|jgi:hypothetical protein|nr:hypothetical protein [Blastocatellia bacterium]